MRGQANTAELLAGNAMLMRLRVREALEKVATVLTDTDAIACEALEQIRRRAGELVWKSHRGRPRSHPVGRHVVGIPDIADDDLYFPDEGTL